MALTIIASHRAGTGHLLKIDNGVITQHLALGHDVEVVRVTVLVRAADGRTPLGVAVVRAQVRHHHDDGLACHAARPARGAGRAPGGGQPVTLPAAGAAPGEPRAVEEGLRARGCVDASGNAALVGWSAGHVEGHRCGGVGWGEEKGRHRAHGGVLDTDLPREG